MGKLKKISKITNIIFALALLFAVVQFIVNLVQLGTNQVALLLENPGADSVKVSGIVIGNIHMGFWDEQNLSTPHAIKDAITEFLANTFGFVMNLFVICTIRKLLKPMTQGQPYDGSVSRTLKKLGIGCILICVVENVFNALQIQSTHAVFFEIVERNLIGVVSGIASGYSIQLGYLFIGIVLLVFSLVFRYGEELQVQADETL